MLLHIIFYTIIFIAVPTSLIIPIAYYLIKMNHDLYYNYEESHHKKIKEYPKIKFTNFKQYFLINLESWTLRESRVIKGENTTVLSKDPCFTFNFFDYWRYRIFCIDLKKQDKRDKDNEVYIKLLELVQEDINKLKDQTMENNTRAVNTIIEVSKRLKEEI